jgi:hypothetical protein
MISIPRFLLFSDLKDLIILKDFILNQRFEVYHNNNNDAAS